MDIVSACAKKKDAKELAFMQTSMYWMIGREWLIWMGKSTDSWTASCIDIMKSINGGVLETTPQQQENLKVSLSDDGVAYLFGVDAAIKANSQFPPGTEVSDSLMSCHLVPQIFANFAAMLASRYKADLDDNGGRLAELLGMDWSSITGQATDAVYQPVKPYGIPAGIDPGKETNAQPPVPGDTTPPAVGAEKKTNWTPWIIGGVVAVGLGGVAYMFTRKPKFPRAATSNPSGKKIGVSKIELRVGEGPSYMSGKVVDITPKPGVNVWKEANNVLREWAMFIPSESAGYWKQDFIITFKDGNTYKGRYDLVKDDRLSANLSKHIVSHVRFLAGLDRPAHLTEEQYEQFVRRSNLQKDAVEFIKSYDLGPSN